MSLKKTTKKKQREPRTLSSRARRLHLSRMYLNDIYRSSNIGYALAGDNDGTFEIDYNEAFQPQLVRSLTQPVRLNPESEEEREKRLAKRKALTLRIFRKAYENRRHRKAS